MYKLFRFLVIFVLTCIVSLPVLAQSKADTSIDALKAKILDRFKHFSIGFYLDAYDNFTLDSKKDTSNLIPYSANCPVREQIRLNHAAIEINYIDDRVRGRLALQWGDAPNLLSLPESQFIRNLEEARFGFRIIKDLWIDVGYIYNPVGYESSWAIKNDISTVTIGGYFEPGSVLGAKLSYRFSDKFNAGIMCGNPYSLAYGKNTNIAGMTFINWMPLRSLTLSYNNFFGNQALRDADLDNNLFCNNFIVTYYPIPQVKLLGEVDLVAQSNSTLPPDTTDAAYMYSGSLMACYTFFEKFTVAGRIEIFDDPDGFLSGVYEFEGKKRGLFTRGFTVSFEYNPVKIGYVRVSYRYLHANDGNLVFYSNQLDHLNVINITTGVRF